MLAGHKYRYDQLAGHDQAALEPNERIACFVRFAYTHLSTCATYAKREQ